jgi:hypothetical protein
MKMELIKKLQKYCNKQGIIFTSEEDAIEYYKGLVEILEEHQIFMIDLLNQKYEWDVGEYNEVLQTLAENNKK